MKSRPALTGPARALPSSDPGPQEECAPAPAWALSHPWVEAGSLLGGCLGAAGFAR